MTREEYKRHFVGLLKAVGMTIPTVEKHVNRCIDEGLRDFWGVRPWTFKEREHTLGTTTGSDTYDLPDDFESFRTVREGVTNRGRLLQYMPKEDFDKFVGVASDYSSGTPKIFTIFREQASGVYKIRFYPPLGGGEDIFISMFITTPPDVDAVPDKFQSGLEATIAKYVFPYGSAAQTAALVKADNEVRTLDAQDKIDQSRATHFGDGTQVAFVNTDDFYWDEA
jgi:hypothetical protein